MISGWPCTCVDGAWQAAFSLLNLPASGCSLLPVSASSCVTKGIGRLLTKAKVGTTNWVMASRKLQRSEDGKHRGDARTSSVS